MNKLKKIFLTAVATLTVATVSAAGEEPAAESYRNNRHPLLQKDYIQLPLGTIRAEGWMHDQLTRMRDGMTGHLDMDGIGCLYKAELVDQYEERG